MQSELFDVRRIHLLLPGHLPAPTTFVAQFPTPEGAFKQGGLGQCPCSLRAVRWLGRDDDGTKLPLNQKYIFNMQRSFLFFAAVAAVFAIVAGMYFNAETAAAPESSFVMLDGSKTNSSTLRGKVTLVNFWATSCTTCVAEMPQLISTYEKYKASGFDTIAVAMNYDPPSYVVNFSETRKLPFSVAIDNTGEIAKAWGDVKLTPTTYVVNKRGEIVKRYIGQPDFAELHRLIERLLSEA